jgi:hypothetical protein
MARARGVGGAARPSPARRHAFTRRRRILGRLATDCRRSPGVGEEPRPSQLGYGNEQPEVSQDALDHPTPVHQGHEMRLQNTPIDQPSAMMWCIVSRTM